MKQTLLPGIVGNYREEWTETIFRMSFRTRGGWVKHSTDGRPFPIKIRHYK